MKDFYDIYYLSQAFDFEGLKLQEAISATLKCRGTEYDSDSFKRVKVLVNDESMQIKWRYFLRTLHNPDILFSQVMDGITAFIEPVWIAFCNKIEFNKYWDNQKIGWID